MFLISVKNKDLPQLRSVGVAVRINGKPETLRREGDYLTYAENRCKILHSKYDPDMVSFTCASHGDEHEPHIVIEEDGTELGFNFSN